ESSTEPSTEPSNKDIYLALFWETETTQAPTETTQQSTSTLEPSTQTTTQATTQQPSTSTSSASTSSASTSSASTSSASTSSASTSAASTSTNKTSKKRTTNDKDSRNIKKSKNEETITIKSGLLTFVKNSKIFNKIQLDVEEMSVLSYEAAMYISFDVMKKLEEKN
ncbi:unnamed protein product, partial [Diamesa hyperborea]